VKIFYQTYGRAKKKFASFLNRFFTKKKTRIGIYGPPNAGKTTLANRIARDWTGDAIGPVSEIPHETRRARRKENIIISGANGNTITMDIVDTPGVTTNVDYHEFLEFGMEKDEAIIRAREATEGVAEAMHWLREDIDGVIYMLDSSLDPFMQVNIMMIGIIESRKLPVIIVANKIDLPDAVPARIRSAFPQHPVVAISGLEGRNVESLYETMLEYFG
jgi:GTP-binding protein Era